MSSSLTRKIAEGTALLTSGNIITTLLNLLSFIIIVRILDKFDYGLVVLALSAVGIASMALLAGLGGVITSDVSRERENLRYDRAKTLLYRFFQVEVVLGVIVSLIVFISAFYFENRYSEIVGNLVRIASLMVLANGGKKIVRSTFMAHMNFRAVFLLDSLESLSKLAMVVMLGYFLGLGVYGVMAAYPLSIFSAVILTTPAYIAVIKEYFGVTRSKESLFYRGLKSHGKWAIGINPVKQMIGKLPPWIIQFIIGVEAVAVFNVARRALSYGIILLKPLGGVLLPVVSKEIKNIQRVNKILNRGVKYATWFSIPIIFLGIILSPFIFNLLFGQGYVESAKIFQVLIFAMLITPINLVLRPVFFAFKMQKNLFWITFVNVVTFILLSMSLTYILALYGMALAFVINGLIGFGLRYMYLRRKGIKFEFKNILTIDKYDRWLTRKVVRKLQEKFMQMVQR